MLLARPVSPAVGMKPQTWADRPTPAQPERESAAPVRSCPSTGLIPAWTARFALYGRNASEPFPSHPALTGKAGGRGSEGRKNQKAKPANEGERP